MGSVVVACGLSHSTACGIFLDWESTRTPCVVRKILIHRATSKGLELSFEGRV